METIEDAKAKQIVRYFDIFVFAPILIFIGVKGNLSKGMKYTLLILAIGTIIYNAYYLLKYKNNNL